MFAPEVVGETGGWWNLSHFSPTSQRQDPGILNFCYKSVGTYYQKLGPMLKPLVPKFRSDISVRLRDIAENWLPRSWNW